MTKPTLNICYDQFAEFTSLNVKSARHLTSYSHLTRQTQPHISRQNIVLTFQWQLLRRNRPQTPRADCSWVRGSAMATFWEKSETKAIWETCPRPATTQTQTWRCLCHNLTRRRSRPRGVVRYWWEGVWCEMLLMDADKCRVLLFNSFLEKMSLVS